MNKKNDCFSVEGEQKEIGPGLTQIYFPQHNRSQGIPQGTLEYTLKSSIEFYSNYLEWFYKTFNIDEEILRAELFEELDLHNVRTVLVTGCGLGDEVVYLAERAVRESRKGLTIIAQDFSQVFVDYTAKRLDNRAKEFANFGGRIILFNSDASDLPLLTGSCDYAHHFGGINRFAARKAAIHEMARVVRRSGRVVFSDESVAPWLRESRLGRMVIVNNSLYGANAPIEELPENASKVCLKWVVRNMFYLISFTPDFDHNVVNPDSEHRSPRGGSMRKRFDGVLEGVNPSLKERLNSLAKQRKMSQSSYLEQAIEEFLKRNESL